MGDLLSSLYVRYGQGNVGRENQRYAFDITALGKKWANGTASPSKGVIFKATDTYAFGSTVIRAVGDAAAGGKPDVVRGNYPIEATL